MSMVYPRFEEEEPAKSSQTLGHLLSNGKDVGKRKMT